MFSRGALPFADVLCWGDSTTSVFLVTGLHVRPTHEEPQRLRLQG